MTKAEIRSLIDNPAALERLYQDNKTAFKREFAELYPELAGNQLAEFWNERLNYESREISWGTQQDLIFVILASVVAALLAKLPTLLGIDEEIFYQRNIGFIVFPILTIYFAWKNNLTTKQITMAGIAFLIAIVYINYLPDNDSSDSLLLACIHLPIFLWAVVGFAYVGKATKGNQQRLSFLRYNGDLVIMTTLILIAGGLLTAITIGLFSLIGFNIETFYTEYIVIAGVAAAPIIATYITQTNPQLVSRVSPVIAKIFSPLVLITLLVYLGAILFSGKNPYQDREFLMVFNLLLIGVMAIILFSVAETFKKQENKSGSIILFALSIVTIVVNGIALSAIIFRIAEWGITANRLAVLGANVLMLINLVIVSYKLYCHLAKQTDTIEVGNAISMFLPIYIIWTFIVTFIFPFLFHFE